MKRPLRGRSRVHVLTELEQLQAIEKAYSDPERLVRVMSVAADSQDAVAGISREFGLSMEVAWTVTDQQLSAFTGERLAELRARIATIMSEPAAPDDPSRPPARQVMAWVEVVIYDLGARESRIGWSGPDDAASQIPLLDAAIRELTDTRDRMVDNDQAQ